MAIPASVLATRAAWDGAAFASPLSPSDGPLVKAGNNTNCPMAKHGYAVARFTDRSNGSPLQGVSVTETRPSAGIYSWNKHANDQYGNFVDAEEWLITNYSNRNVAPSKGPSWPDTWIETGYTAGAMFNGNKATAGNIFFPSTPFWANQTANGASQIYYQHALSGTVNFQSLSYYRFMIHERSSQQASFTVTADVVSLEGKILNTDHATSTGDLTNGKPAAWASVGLETTCTKNSSQYVGLYYASTKIDDWKGHWVTPSDTTLHASTYTHIVNRPGYTHYKFSVSQKQWFPS